ncbi:MAG TPA: ribosome maturation factor RimP [Gemmatimonadaceae bacterium]|nr:ribosome maturation factor RimP [Gemmatimonadaceae bacterium]
MWGRLPTFFCSRGLPRRLVKEELEAIVVRELDALQLELVEFRRGGSRSRPVLDVRIDRRDGAAVTVDDCARASRAIEAQLDAGDVLGERYVLEVSSPGIERPLRTPADWRRFVGRSAVILAPALGGRVEVEILAVEGESGAEVAVLRDGRGAEHRVPLLDVKEARLAFHW